MILKLDFSQIEKVFLTFKFSKSESFLIDEATYQKYQIDSSGQKKKKHSRNTILMILDLGG
jgi:hypothetical protein